MFLNYITYGEFTPIFIVGLVLLFILIKLLYIDEINENLSLLRKRNSQLNSRLEELEKVLHNHKFFS